MFKYVFQIQIINFGNIQANFVTLKTRIISIFKIQKSLLIVMKVILNYIKFYICPPPIKWAYLSTRECVF